VFAVFGGMIVGGFAGAFHAVLMSGTQFTEPTLGAKAQASMVAGGILGVVIGGMLARKTVEAAGPSLVAILCGIGFIIGLAVGVVLGPPSQVPLNMPDRTFFGIGNYGCIGWFGRCILAHTTRLFRR
jgi:hypothetical protein